MIRRLPVIPTVLVIGAAALMVALGIWQLGRVHQKEALIVRYRQAEADTAPVPWPRDEAAIADALYRRSAITCARVTERSARAGTSARGTPGWAQTARCVLDGDTQSPGGEALVELGWTRAPDGPPWAGGRVTGVVAPGPRLIADPPRAGLAPLAKPDPGDLPNNHFAYAIQWFVFAATALVIYALAVRRRMRS